jgi:hypothetical protein
LRRGGVDPRALITLALAMPITVLWSFLMAIGFGRSAQLLKRKPNWQLRKWLELRESE